MDNEIRETVDSLCKTSSKHDERLSEVEQRLVNLENEIKTDLSYIKDCFRDIDKNFEIVKHAHNTLLEGTKNAMLYICGVFAGLHVPEAAEGLKIVFGLNDKGE